MQNTDIFNYATLEIFRACLESFPNPVNIDSDEIAKVVLQKFPDFNEEQNELFNNLMQVKINCNSTVTWLKEEGFLRVIFQPMNGPVTATLTSKGLVATNADVVNLEKKLKFSDYIKTGIKDVGINLASNLIQKIITSASCE